MESVYFLGTPCTSRTDEGKMDMDNFHIHHKISVDYSTEVCTRVVFLWGTSPPSPRQIKSRHVSINWICTRFISEKPDPVSSIFVTGLQLLEQQCHLQAQRTCLTVFFYFSFKSAGIQPEEWTWGTPLIPWRDSPVCTAAEASGVVAGRGSQSVC